MNEKTNKLRKNQVEKRKRLILERPAPDYPDDINYQEHWDEITITRHSPYGDRTTNIILFMCPTKIDSHYLMRDGYLKLENKRPKRLGSYKVGEYICKLLGRRGRFEY